MTIDEIKAEHIRLLGEQRVLANKAVLHARERVRDMKGVLATRVASTITQIEKSLAMTGRDPVIGVLIETLLVLLDE